MSEDAGRTMEIARRRRRRRFRIAGIVALLVALGFGINVYLATRPARVASLVREALAQVVRGEVRFAEQVDLHWGREIVFHHVALVPTDEKAGGAFARARRVVLRPSFSSLLLGTVVVEEVLVESPVVSLSRDETGRWSFEGLLAVSGADLDAIERFPTVRVISGAVHYRDSFGQGAPVRQDLLGIDTVVERGQGGDFSFSGRARTPFLDDLEVGGSFDASVGRVALEVRASRFDADARLARLFGPQAGAVQKQLNVHGVLDVEGRFTFDAESGLAPTGVTGRFLQCYVQPPGFPFPIEQVSGGFTLDGERLVADRLEGRLGAGRFVCRAALTAAAGWTKLSALDLELTADAVPLDARVGAWIPEHLMASFAKLATKGAAKLKITIHDDELPVVSDDVALELSFDELEWVYRDVPYGFGKTQGTARIEDGRLSIVEPIVARRGDTVLELSGGADLAPDGAFDIELGVKRLPLDDALRNALPASGLVRWDRFQPSGTADVEAAFRREAGGETEAAVTFHCRGASVGYEWFPYALHGLEGDFVLDLARDEIRLEGVRGLHGSQLVTAQGRYALSGDESFELRVQSEQFEIDDEFRAALSPESRALLGELGLSARASVDAVISSSIGRPYEVRATAKLIDGSVRYEQFPMPLELESGTLEVHPDRRVSIRDVVLRGPGAAATLSGEIQTVGGERAFDYELHVERVDVDGRLRAALPVSLRRLADGLRLRGEFGGELFGTTFYNVSDPALSKATYHATGVHVHGGAIDFGVAMRGLVGSGEFVGEKSLSTGHRLTGIVRMRDSSFNRIRFDDTFIRFTYGQEHPGVRDAHEGRTLDGTSYRPPPELLGRLSEGEIEETIQAQIVESRLYDGFVEGFLAIDVGERNDVMGDFVARGIRVPRAAKDVFGVEGTGLAGVASGNVRFRGTTGVARSLQGAGRGTIRDARLLQLPLFVNVISLLFLRPTVDPHFNRVDLSFDIRDSRFWAPGPDGCAVYGNSMNLLGAGSMDFDGGLDLAFTPHFLDFRIPLLEHVFELLKKTFIQIIVRGRLESPEVKLGTAAGIVELPVGGGARSEEEK